VLTRVTVSTSALAAPRVEPAGERYYHEDLARLLFSRTVPVFGSHEHLNAFRRAAEATGGARDIWAQYLSDIRQRPSPEVLTGLPDAAEATSAADLAAWAEHVDLVLLGLDDVERMRLDRARPLWDPVDDRPACARALYADRHPALAGARDHAVVQTVYGRNQEKATEAARSRKEIAKRFMIPLLPKTRLVTVADPYLHAVLREDAADSSDDGACMWFIDLVAKHAAVDDTELVLYTTFVEPNSAAAQKQALDEILARLATRHARRPGATATSALAAIELRFVRRHEGPSKFHDRFILFEYWAAISLSRGLHVFKTTGRSYSRAFDHEIVYCPRELALRAPGAHAGSVARNYDTKISILRNWKEAARRQHGAGKKQRWEWNGACWALAH
jgi:hypothetical protein